MSTAKKTKATHWSTSIRRMGACQDGLVWARKQRSLRAAWHACENPAWLFWYAGRKAKTETDRKRIVLAACACARTALKFVKPGEDRPRKCIETTEAWCAGKATLEEVRVARSDAYAAYAAAAAAADAAAAAYAYAADAADAAAADAAYAAYAADAADAADAAADAAAAAAAAADAADADAAADAADAAAAAAADADAADADAAAAAAAEKARASARAEMCDLIRKAIPMPGAVKRAKRAA